MGFEQGFHAAEATVFSAAHRFDSASMDSYAAIACSSHTSRRSLSLKISSCALFKESRNLASSSAVPLPPAVAPPLLLPYSPPEPLSRRMSNGWCLGVFQVLQACCGAGIADSTRIGLVLSMADGCVLSSLSDVEQTLPELASPSVMTVWVRSWQINPKPAGVRLELLLLLMSTFKSPDCPGSFRGLGGLARIFLWASPSRSRGDRSSLPVRVSGLLPTSSPRLCRCPAVAGATLTPIVSS